MSVFARAFQFLPVALLLSGCVTTADVTTSMQDRWTGQPVDAFFRSYGPPASSYKLGDGGQIFTWRGGTKVRHVPADYAIIHRDPFFDMRPGFYRDHPFYDGFDDPQMVMVAPPRDETLNCEAQITVSRKRTIQSIRISSDTDGEGLSMSRCADVFGIKK